MDDKPFGWRPLDDEQRQKLVEIGFDDNRIAELERQHVYAPNHDAVIAREFVVAIMDAIGRRHGSAVIKDVRHVLERRVEQMEDDGTVEDLVEARILRETIDTGVDWDALIDRASDPDHECWKPDGSPR